MIHPIGPGTPPDLPKEKLESFAEETDVRKHPNYNAAATSGSPYLTEDNELMDVSECSKNRRAKFSISMKLILNVKWQFSKKKKKNLIYGA